ncbi:UDP-glycosyltransferase 83A1 [Lactuca sativa]|uniref:Uncharacterized protein n=1 Tax=Lactuca sativa TaxID=4236 RepID=A0A9R1X5S7_LACSA|nr:UDP-glycosyltransferase 83A1 [Lactuca sativa]KAJ0196967.1 hypothetical protein LSAT_V11C700358360 [Lactuca sativa]
MDSRDKSQFPARQAASNYKQRKNQAYEVTVVNIAVTYKQVTSNALENDCYSDLLRSVSIPDGLEPWEDRTEICKLTLSILQTMPGKLEELIVTINKEDNNKMSCIIADDCMGWAIKVAKKMGISRAAVWPATFPMLTSMLSCQKLIDGGIINNNGIPLIQHMIKLSETMPLIKPTNLWWTRFEDLPTSEAFFEVVKEAAEASRLTEWHLCRSTTELEPGALC